MLKFFFLSFIFYSSLFLSSTDVIAQSKINRNYNITWKATAGIPTPTFNPAFKKVFTGTLDASTNFTFNVYKGFFIGASSKFLLLKIIPTKLALVNTEYHAYNAGLATGYEFQIDESAVMVFSVAGGKNWINYTKVSVPDKITSTTPRETHFDAFNIETSVGYYFYTEDNFALGGNFSYNVIYNTFNPNTIYLDNFKNFAARDYKGYTQYFAISFGVYYGFWHKKI